jgi:hypothetical protein
VGGADCTEGLIGRLGYEVSRSRGGGATRLQPGH